MSSAKWDADLVREDLREYVVEHLGDEESGVLITDETGFLKKGHNSVGVARQYTGTVGDTVDCQVGVFVAYSSNKGADFIDRALYLPEGWANYPKRRTEAGVPEEVAFENKIEFWPRGCSRGHSRLASQRGGLRQTPSTAVPTSSRRGWRSGGAPTR